MFYYYMENDMWLKKLAKNVSMIESKNKNDLIIRINFNKDHSIFQEHFPGNPILPGSFIIGVVKNISQIYLNKKNMHLKKIERFSYIKPIRFETIFILSCQSSKQENGLISVRIIIKDDLINTYVKGALVYQVQHQKE